MVMRLRRIGCVLNLFAQLDNCILGLALRQEDPAARQSCALMVGICPEDLRVPAFRLVGPSGSQVKLHQTCLEVEIAWCVLSAALVFGGGAFWLIPSCKVIAQREGDFRFFALAEPSYNI